MITIKFPSKKDIWLGFVLWGCIGFGIFISISSIMTNEASLGGAIFTILLNILFILFIGWLWFSTYYVLEEKEINIRCGPIKKRIPYREITSAHKTWNPLSSPALSLKRISLAYQFGTVLISPKDRDQFLALLKERCPHAAINSDNK